MIKTCLSFFFMFIIHTLSIAQEYYDGDSLITKGQRLHDAEAYEEAIATYKEVDKLDPQYLKANYEIAYSLSSLEKYEEAIQHLQPFYETGKFKEFPLMYVARGNALSNLKRYEESEKTFSEGMEYLNNHSGYYFNYGLMAYQNKDLQKSIDMLMKTIDINPNSSRAYYLLGAIAFENGWLSEGSLFMLAYLTNTPGDSYTNDAIIKLNSKMSQYPKKNDKISFSKSGDDFSELDIILRNQLPLNEKYKLKLSLDDILPRHIQAICEYAVEHKGNKGFLESVFIPYLSDIQQMNLVEGFTLYTLLSKEEALSKAFKSNKAKVTAYIENYHQNKLWPKFSRRERMHFGSKKFVNIFIEDDQPFLVGEVINEKYQGKFTVMNTIGQPKSELNYKDGMQEGEQIYFSDDGKINERTHFKSDKKNGSATFYYDNGNQAAVYQYVDDILEGNFTTFYLLGGKQCEGSYSQDKLTGKHTCYYTNGIISSQKNFANDLYDGKIIYFYDNGDTSAIEHYTAGVMNGVVKKFLPMHQQIYLANVENDNIITSTNYYYNGKVENELTTIKGEKKQISYYENGKIKNETYVKKNGEDYNIKYFDRTGKLWSEEVYEKNILKKTLLYQGSKVIEEIKAKSGITTMKEENGNIFYTGSYTEGIRNGLHKTYYENGILRSEENYLNGLLHGSITHYDQYGGISAKGTYFEGSIYGEYEINSEEGIKSVYNYKKDVLHGPFKKYKNEKLIEEGFYNEGKFNGDLIQYWLDGGIKYINTYVDDEFIKSSSFTSDGKINYEYTIDQNLKKLSFNSADKLQSFEFELLNGYKTGKYIIKKNNKTAVAGSYINFKNDKETKIYYDNGNISQELNYVLNNLHGTQKYYDFNQKLKSENTYVHGNEEGPEKRYFASGGLFFEGQSTNNKRWGQFRYYNQEGIVILVLHYENNYIKAYQSLTNGILQQAINTGFDKKHVIKSTYSGGSVAAELVIDRQMLDVHFNVYGENRQPQLTTTYHARKLHGARNEYYPTGKIYKTENFLDGNYHGTQTYHSETGAKLFEYNFENDDYQGDQKEYKNGILSITYKYKDDELIEVIQH